MLMAGASVPDRPNVHGNAPAWTSPKCSSGRGEATHRRPAGLTLAAQFALKPASKALGLHGVFIRAKGFKYLIADSAFKRMQVDALGACWLDAHEHHLGLALRTGRALNCSEWNDG